MMEQTRDELVKDISKLSDGSGYTLNDDLATCALEIIADFIIAREQSLKERQREFLEKVKDRLDDHQWGHKSVEDCKDMLNSELSTSTDKKG